MQADVWVNGEFRGRADVAAGRPLGLTRPMSAEMEIKIVIRALGVLKAVNNVNNAIHQALIGMEVTDQRNIDLTLKELDGTPNKRRLGANAILGVSLAVARAAANVCRAPLYCYINPNGHVIPVPHNTDNILIN